MKIALDQINKLNLDPQKPIVICDVDEVIFYFIRDFIQYSKKLGFLVNIQNYSLFGNVTEIKTSKIVPMEKISVLIDNFFAEYVGKQNIVEGARESLELISLTSQIVILTNIPHIYAPKRRERLLELGLHYPMISSSGPKGVLVKAISEKTSLPVIFIDDIAYHINSVADEIPAVLRIHYIADKTLNKTEPMAEKGNHKCDDWTHISDVIHKFIA